MTLLDAVRSAMLEEMRADPRVIVLGEDVGRRGGVFRATDGFIDEFGEERVIDTPLAESLIVGTAVGASANGLLPIAEIQFADFVHAALDQIISEAARIRYRSNNGWSCPIVVRMPYGGGIHGALYHSQSVEAFFTHVPGLRVVAPCMPVDAKGLLAAAIQDPDPVIFLEHKRTYRLLRQDVPDGRFTLPIGVARVPRSGRHQTLITYGLMTHFALEAAERASGDGIDVEVIDLCSLKPLDTATIFESVRKTGKVLVIHEDNITGGFGGEIVALIAAHVFEYLDAPIRRLCGPDVPAMPFAPPLEDAFLPSPEKIYAAVRDLAAY
jgi:2-oxoisovalerate dehydrogenase E1 component beta subunit